jgi:hypothetical protein
MPEEQQIVIRISRYAAIAMVVAGCAASQAPAPTVRLHPAPPPPLPRTEPAPVISGEEFEVIELIKYAQRVAAMSPEQKRAEQTIRNQAFSRDKDAASRMRLALVLATPEAGGEDVTRAENLLRPLASPGVDAGQPMRLFARLLYGLIHENVGEKQRANQLRNQLEALKDVERSMLQRKQDNEPPRK